MSVFSLGKYMESYIWKLTAESYVVKIKLENNPNKCRWTSFEEVVYSLYFCMFEIAQLENYM